jgi:RHS repeat-associated protein
VLQSKRVVLMLGLLAGLLAGCPDDQEPDGDTPDSGALPSDAGASDGGATLPDAGGSDGGAEPHDAGVTDAGTEPHDAGVTDGGTTPTSDGGSGDAGPVADTLAPTWGTGSALSAEATSPTSLLLSWSSASDNVGVTMYRLFQNGTQLAELPASTRQQRVTGLAAGSQHHFKVEAGDLAGNFSSDGPALEANVVPPNPTIIAPPVDGTVATTLADATAFLYTGNDPPQRGVAPGTIEPRRVSVLRGQVRTRDDAPLPGVTIRISGHPEFGTTVSRADGMFELVVNGGGPLVLDYQKSDFLPVQRTVVAPWQDYARVPTVVMIPQDTAHTTVLAQATTVQVAQASPVTDADGSRQQTLLFSPGTEVTVALPNGGSAPLSSLTVRATEYTVGPNGPAAMPGTLPPQSGYTYAVEFTVDEAQGAEVSFNPPVISYVQNFIGFPVGQVVPSGYYDRTRGIWVASDNGKVIAIVGQSGGLAEVDLNGDGNAESVSALEALGITEAERTRLATLYPAGQTLWRVPIPHFSPWDFNWPKGPPPGASGPPAPPPPPPPPPKPCTASGSIIGCEEQTLGEELAVPGTSLSLRYQSDRSAGRKELYAFPIVLSGPTIPSSLKRIDLEVRVAGQFVQQSFPAAPGQSTTFVWDGKDAFGRKLQGRQPAHARVGFVYGAVYQQPSEVQKAFGTFSGVLSGSPARDEVTIWSDRFAGLGPWDVRRQAGLGGWNLNVHHGWDPVSKVLFMGDGTQRSAEAQVNVINSVAGTLGIEGCCGDGNPATSGAYLRRPRGIAVGPDGSLYIADRMNHRVRKVDPDGIIHTIAGNGNAGNAGEGGPATAAQLYFPMGLALAQDGSLYISEPDDSRIVRVSPDGVLTRFAGNHVTGNTGDGGPATEASIGTPWSVAVGPDGSVYFGDGIYHVVRRIAPDGTIHRFAGTGVAGFGGDGGPALSAQFNRPLGVATGPDGSVYIADFNNLRVRRVGPDGIIRTFAGNGNGGGTGNGGPALSATFQWPISVAVADDGRVFIAEDHGGRVRMVGTDGILTLVAGQDDGASNPPTGDRGPAVGAFLNTAYNLAVSPDGKSLYLNSPSTIRRVASPLPIAVGDLFVPSSDGSEVYVFSPQGRHLRTLDSLTGDTVFSFTYDSANRLIGVTDADGKVTQIQRDTQGNPTAIVSPRGHITTLTLDADGNLATFTNPAQETTQFTYTPDGLLQTLTDPRGKVHRYTYDADGRLIKDEAPAGTVRTLTRTVRPDGFTVQVSTTLGRTNTYTTRRHSNGVLDRTITDASGGVTLYRTQPDGTNVTVYPDGNIATFSSAPDPRWGMLAPYVAASTLTTPQGRKLVTTMTRTVTLADPLNLLSVQTQTDTQTINGHPHTRTFHRATRTVTEVSAEGQRTTLTLDAGGRLTAISAPGLSEARLTYNSYGELMREERGTRFREYTRDARGRPIEVVDESDVHRLYTYDDAGRVLTATAPSGRTLTFQYDASGNRTRLGTPTGRQHQFGFNDEDLFQSHTLPSAAGPYLWSRDPDGLIDTFGIPSGQEEEHTLDPGGRLSRTQYAEATIDYSYAGNTPRLASISRTASGGGAVERLTYTYDGSLLLSVTSIGSAPGTYQYAYGNDLLFSGRTFTSGGDTQSVVTTRDRDGKMITFGPFTYDRQTPERSASQIRDAALDLGFSFNDQGRISGRSHKVAGQVLYQVAYTFDGAGRVARKVETINGAAVTFDYVTDADGQLTAVKRDGVQVEHFTYDDEGNRLSRLIGSNVAEDAHYDTLDRLLDRGGTVYGFNADGFLTARGVDAFSYSARGELLSATVGGVTVTYAYDGHGRRVARISPQGTERYFYGNPDRPFEVTHVRDGAGVLSSYYYDEAGLLFAFERAGSRYYVATDGVGSPRLIADATGAVMKTLEYDSFGVLLSDSAPGFAFPFGFQGGLADPLTGLVRFGARDYEPSSGRWMARDPSLFEGAQLNLYAFVGNNPVSARDPEGRREEAISASYYYGGGGGGTLSNGPGGLTGCIEVGAGFGGGVSFGTSDSPPETSAALDFSYGPINAGWNSKGGLYGSADGFFGTTLASPSPKFEAGAKFIFQKCWKLWTPPKPEATKCSPVPGPVPAPPPPPPPGSGGPPGPSGPPRGR